MKKIILSIATITALSSSVSAGWIEDNMIEVGTDAGYYETQTRGIYSLGSTTIRFKEVGGTITPFHLEPPRFNVGCGGIDISMGGFSYLKKEFIVEKLKAISAAAPAFVYQMAISALCKDCQNIMNELEKFSSMINGLNFDTCDAIQAAQGAGKLAGEAMNSNLLGGQSDSWMSEKVKSGREKMEGWGNGIKTFFGGDAQKSKEMMDIMVLKGSLLDLAITKGLPDTTKLDILGNDSSGDKLLLSSFRAVTGDIMGGVDYDGNPMSYEFEGITKNNLFKTIYEGGKLPIASYDKTTLRIKYQGEYDLTKGSKDVIKDNLIAIYNKLAAKQSLDATDKKFLSTLSFPIYKYLNNAVVNHLGTVEIDMIAGQIAAQQTANFIYYMTRIMTRGLAIYTATHGKDMSEEVLIASRGITQGINQINTETREQLKTILDDFTMKSKILDYFKKQSQETMSKHPFYQEMMSAVK